MDNDHHTLSFGAYLKEARLQSGIDLKTISMQTRIAETVLVLIENEAHENLPAPTYVKGFIKAYAQKAGADPDEALILYSRALNEKESAANSTKRLRNRSVFMISAAAVVFVAALCLIVFKDALFVKTSSDAEIPPPVQVQKPAADSVENKQPAEDTAKKTTEKLQLKITAMEKTDIKVIVDGAEPKSYGLKPGDRLELEALSDFNLLIGNAGGVALTLNGEPVKLSGKSGQMVTLQLP